MWRDRRRAKRVLALATDLGRIREGPYSDGHYLYWLETRPREGGRSALVRCGLNGSLTTLLQADERVGANLHGYGGGALAVNGQDDGSFCFIRQSSQEIVLVRDSAEQIRSIDHSDFDHGDLASTTHFDRVLAVRESRNRHTTTIVREIVGFALTGPIRESVLASGHDFFAFACVDPSGKYLAYMAWDHPNMPWDNTAVFVVELDPQSGLPVSTPVLIDGGEGYGASQPMWRKDGELLWLADKDGYSQPYSAKVGGAAIGLCDVTSDFQRPQWQAGVRTVIEMNDTVLLAIRHNGGTDELGIVTNGHYSTLSTKWKEISGVTVFNEEIALCGATEFEPAAIWVASLTEVKNVLKNERVISEKPKRLSSRKVAVAKHVTAKNADGDEVNAYFYEAKARAGRKAPAVVSVHGGPTGNFRVSFDPVVQFLVASGISVIGVDYGGSAGYGTRYRRRLEGKWGILDLSDCVTVVEELVSRGVVDADKIAIRGSSSGGLTALLALADAQVFRCAVSYYGVCDLERLCAITHDFESRYMDRLIGPLPESLPLYQQRSPIHRTATMHGAVLLFQGTDDVAVPLEQAETMAAALGAVGVDVSLTLYKGEGHGFRRSDSKRDCLKREILFYRRVLA